LWLRGVEQQTKSVLDFTGCAGGLPTAGRLSVLEARWRPTVANTTQRILDHKTKMTFRSDLLHKNVKVVSTTETDRTTYKGHRADIPVST
jgi:hypothetical protein